MNTLLILDLAAKSLAVLLAAFAVQSLWRRASAAQRCLIWLATFGCLLVLPLTLLVEPQWTLTQERQEAPPTNLFLESITPLPVPQALAARAAEPGPVSSAPRIPPLQAAIAVWLAGALLVLGHRWLGSWRLRQLRKQSTLCREGRIVQQVTDFAQALGIRRAVQVRTSGAVAVPVTWGVFQPVLLLPADAPAWNDETLSAALRHELAHIRHFDAATRLMATFVCACHWPNVLVWIAARRWRTAQEQAADDLVLRTGASPQNYALQLLQAARSFQVAGFTRAPVLAMARPATLETRLSAIMDAGRNRRHVERKALWVAAVTAALFMGGLSSLRLQAQSVKVPESASAAKASDTGEVLVVVELKVLEALPSHVPEELRAVSGKVISDQEMNVLLRSVLQDPEVKVISSPRMVTRNLHEVSIQSMVNVPVPNGQPPLPIGQKFNILPSVHEGSIDLTVDLSVTEQIGEDKGFPIVSSRTHSSSVTVPEQHTAVFGFQDAAAEAKPPRASGKQLICLVTAKRIDTRVASALSEVEKLADAVILPRVQFSGASFDEAIEFLRAKGRLPSSPEPKVINILVSGKPQQTKLDLDLQDVQFSQVLRQVADQAGLELRYQGNTAILVDRGSPAKTAAGLSDSPAAQRTRSLILPRVQFAKATLAEAVDFLRVKSRELSPDKKGINLVIKDGAAASEPRITLDLQMVSVDEVLRHTAALAGFAVAEDGGLFVLTPLKP